jgi:hypothetical protein
MTKKNWILIIFAAALAGVYVVYFTDWFKPKVVQIFHTYRDTHHALRRARDGQLPALKFGITRKIKLTELKVVPLAEWQTNQHTLAVWHLVTDSNSVPLGEFFYGQFIGGMKPAIKGTHSQSLETNVTYRLFLTAGNVTGQHDFELK